MEHGSIHEAQVEIGRRMRQRRKEQGLSQAQVAKLLKRTKTGAQSAISRWEAAEVPPTIREILAYAEAVNTPISFFVDGIVTKSAEQLTSGLDHEAEDVVVSLVELLKKRKPATPVIAASESAS